MSVRIGKYEIQEELGGGAFTRVLKAWDTAAKRTVALKVPATAAEEDPFVHIQNEAAALSRLRHTNIVGIYEWGEDKGRPFVAVEYVPGTTLRRIIDTRDVLTFEEKLRIMAQVTEALRSVHENGGVHLDIRPVNIMVLPDGAAKVLDFGSVELTEESAARLAREGYLKGILLYAAPEQLSSGAAASESLADVFTCGTIFYELLTGRHPFQATEEKEIIAKILNENPTGLRTLIPDCPKALAQVVHRALQKDPRLRYQTAAELHGEIESVLAEIRSQAVPRKPATKDGPTRRRLRRAAVGAPALLLAATAWGVLPRFTHREAATVVASAAPSPAAAAPPVATVKTLPRTAPRAAAAHVARSSIPAPVPPPEGIQPEENFEQAKVLRAPAPSLPTLAQGRDISGVVQLEATVDEEGYVKDVSVVSGDALLTAAAREAVLQWRYVPAKRNGEPTEAKVPIQIVFQPSQ